MTDKLHNHLAIETRAPGLCPGCDQLARDFEHIRSLSVAV